MQATELWQEHPRFRNIPPTTEQKWGLIKDFRYGLLQRSNWTQLSDALLTLAEKEAWRTYRDTLQNIEYANPSPDVVVFPDEPISTSTPTTPEIVDSKAIIAQYKTEYISTIATLQTIEDTSAPTNAQVIAAVKFLAKTLKLIIKLLLRLLV